MSDYDPTYDLDVCGETYDHRLDDGDTQDGITTQTCRECGAERVTEANG